MRERKKGELRTQEWGKRDRKATGRRGPDGEKEMSRGDGAQVRSEPALGWPRF